MASRPSDKETHNRLLHPGVSYEKHVRGKGRNREEVIIYDCRCREEIGPGGVTLIDCGHPGDCERLRLMDL